jgi:enoyl-CoA hydratase/carnithine racemase
MDTPLKYERQGNIVFLTLNDPKTRNAISGEEMFAAFEESIKKINADLVVRVVVLTGEGSAFCSGGNLRHMREKTGMFSGAPHQIARQYRHGIQRIPRAMAALEVPSIAAVNGPAIGVGCDLACMCDIRIASESATFAESFVKVGIVPGDGGAWLLQRVIGYSRAAELSFTGDTIDASTAREIGLVSKVVAAEDLRKEALALAERIAQNPGGALRLTKRLLQQARQESLEVILEMSASYQALAHHTADHSEAVASILDKRKPTFEES